MLEVGGGQIALLCNGLFGCQAEVADISDRYAASVTRHGLTFHRCDLLRDDLPSRESYDVVVLCEVVEHLPVPLHLVLAHIARWIRPGGYLFLTTPNLNRIRNVIRLAQGRSIFCPLTYPKPGASLGHPFEFSASVLRWHLEAAGLSDVSIRYEQLVLGGFSPVAWLGRNMLSPILALRPVWRDSLVAHARKVATPDARDGGAAANVFDDASSPYFGGSRSN
jgi:SAM-dependent methyltransferase